MANVIGLITKYGTKAWDKVYKAEACSSVLDGDKDLMKFTGVKTVKIAKFASSGLGDYHRANKQVAANADGSDTRYAGNDTSNYNGSKVQGYGYQQGDVSLEWEEFTIRCDRGTQLRIELFDDEETDGLAVATATKEFSRTKVIPEVDAYVFSTLAELAGTKVNSTTAPISLGSAGDHGYNPNGPIQRLNDAFEVLADYEVPETDQVIFCSNSFYNNLRSTGEIVKHLTQTEYGENVKFSIGEYEGREIIAVPANRFRTLIQLNGDDGYSWKTGSEKIDFMVVAKSAVAHVTKYDKVKVFSPEVVQDFDGYKVNVRIYHDVFVPDNKRIAIYVHTSSGSVPAPTVKFNAKLVEGTTATALTLSGVALVPGDILADSFYIVPTTAPGIGDALSAISDEIKVALYAENSIPRPASNASNLDYYLCAVKDGKVVAVNGTDKIAINKQAQQQTK